MVTMPMKTTTATTITVIMMMTILLILLLVMLLPLLLLMSLLLVLFMLLLLLLLMLLLLLLLLMLLCKTLKNNAHMGPGPKVAECVLGNKQSRKPWNPKKYESSKWSTPTAKASGARCSLC